MPREWNPIQTLEQGKGGSKGWGAGKRGVGCATARSSLALASWVDTLVWAFPHVLPS